MDTEPKHTADEIRAYCEAASEGPWVKNEQWYGDILSHTRRPVGRMYHANNHDFVVNARTDLPRVLEAAVTERDVLVTLVRQAGLISRKLSSNRPVTNLDVMALDDARWAAGTVIDETAWLADSPEADNGESET